LRSKPFFVDESDEKILVETAARLKFRPVGVDFPRDAGNPEEGLLKELTKRLDFSRTSRTDACGLPAVRRPNRHPWHGGRTYVVGVPVGHG
jgi:hypothetical protein